MASYELADRSAEFPRLLRELEQSRVSVANASHLPEAVTTRHVQLKTIPSSLADLDLSNFQDYNVFPKNILTFLGCWQVERRAMQIGDTIVQQACLPPISALSVKVIMGVRIVEVVSTAQQIGFSYATLEGHLERGTASWYVRLEEDGLRLEVVTRSRPANPLARMVAPVFTLPYQAWVARRALETIEQRFKGLNQSWTD